ncbi:glycoside hydrolase family 38 C-terminal domain-containing protein [Streptomyces sp. NPDC051940]|uniref:glycoside hydrolase family 38 N-terminal domain-containing protein n=1 Tax=Streptomyces sp. NPDC051940 TaxID=3155675 RepID=UPI00342F9514
MSVAITAVESTDLFTGTEHSPHQVLRVTVEAPAPVRVTVDGPGVRGEATGTGPVEVPLTLADAPPAGTVLPVTVRAGGAAREAEVVVAEPGWTMFMVSHFHYDPVWWNTQGSYTTPWELLTEDGSTRPPFEWNSFALVDAHLDLARRDPDYKFVLAEIDYLKPYFDTHPERRAELRQLLAAGRVELIGGTYNEPNTNLTGAEATIRNLVYGIGYQRDILGGEPRSAWQLDVFGHDPQFPGYLDAAGLTGSAWARGPFHQWGPIQKNFRDAHNDATVMQFASEFEWLAPSGRGVLTHYMPHHYSAGWWMDSAADLAEAEAAVYELYRRLKPVAATRNLLLPVGTDYTPPNKWVTAIHRSWAAKYVWPRFVCGTPHEFLTAVRAGLAAAGRRPSPQTRDMNPVYTGKDVSYIDTKQAQRAGEVAAVDAEKLATIAALQGLGRYPDAALDKVWRQLAYGAHHDAITGSESDQVYLDLLGGWREAHDLAAGVRDTALAALTGRVDTRGDGVALVVTNTLSFPRSGVVSVPLPDGCGRVVDDTGSPVPSAVERGVLHFLAQDVPSLGWRTWRLVPGEADALWSPAEGDTAQNARFRVTADAARGGALTSVYDKAHGRELIQDGAVGNELRVYEEYPTHPDFGEGPWHLLPKGPAVAGSAAAPGSVRRETGPLGERLVGSGTVDGMRYEQTVTLWRGVGRVDCVTRVVDFAGSDRLVRLRFPVDVPGGLPVSEVAGAVIGRGFALPDVDVAEAPWTLDNPANTWFGLGSTARVTLTAPDGSALGDRALGVAEVVVPAGHDGSEARALVVAMARAGVTATTSAADRSRYGWLDVDSNLPDFRVVVGGPEVNELAREILERAGAGHAAAFAEHGRVWVPAEKPLHEVWQPMADLRDPRALPALVVADPDALAGDFADARVSAVCAGALPASEVLADRTAALLTYGLPGFAVDASGALHLSLMRSCTGWPSGVWIDPPRRTVPDGSAFQLQHWTHEFAYALVTGDGDWRTLTLPAQGQEFNHPLYAQVEQPHDGTLPATHSWVSVSPPREVLLGTLKPAGNPVAHGSSRQSDPAAGVTLRLLESTGFGRTAQVGGALALGELREADLLERPGGAPAPLSLAGSEVATVVGRCAASAAQGPVLGATAEAAQPVYARYWLHNRGPAPLGYLPVSVAVTPGLAATSGESVRLSVALSSQLTDAAVEGTAEVVVPEGWRADVRRRPYRLEPSGHVRFPVVLSPPDGAEPGTYFAAVRTESGGQTVEDVVTLRVGEGGDAGGLDVSVRSASVRVRPGGSTTLDVVLANRTRGEIRGEVQAVSPWGTWQLLPDPVRGVAVSPGSQETVSFRIAAPADLAPGSFWVLAKVMWFGRCQYAPTVELVVEEEA